MYNTIFTQAVKLVIAERRVKEGPIPGYDNSTDFPRFSNVVRLMEVYKILHQAGKKASPRWMPDAKATIDLGELLMHEAR